MVFLLCFLLFVKLLSQHNDIQEADEIRQAYSMEETQEDTIEEEVL